MHRKAANSSSSSVPTGALPWMPATNRILGLDGSGTSGVLEISRAQMVLYSTLWPRLDRIKQRHCSESVPVKKKSKYFWKAWPVIRLGNSRKVQLCLSFVVLFIVLVSTIVSFSPIWVAVWNQITVSWPPSFSVICVLHSTLRTHWHVPAIITIL